MPKFHVTVTRDTTESTTLLVDAESESAAEQAALEISYADPSCEWSGDDTPNASSDHYTNGAEVA